MGYNGWGGFDRLKMGSTVTYEFTTGFSSFFLSAGFIESMGSFSGFFLLFFFRVGEKDFTGFYRVLLGWPGRLAAG